MSATKHVSGNAGCRFDRQVYQKRLGRYVLLISSYFSFHKCHFTSLAHHAQNLSYQNIEAKRERKRSVVNHLKTCWTNHSSQQRGLSTKDNEKSFSRYGYAISSLIFQPKKLSISIPHSSPNPPDIVWPFLNSFVAYPACTMDIVRRTRVETGAQDNSMGQRGIF